MLLSLDRLNMVCQISEGLGSILPSITRLGSADKGVSTWSRERCGADDMGGAGLANGLGGPDAPAERPGLLVDGDGGGRTTPLFCSAFTGGAVEAASFSDESPVPSSPSDCSLGICTVKRGRFASDCKVLDLLGAPTVATEDVDPDRWGGRGGGGWNRESCDGLGDLSSGVSRCIEPTSIDRDRGASLLSALSRSL